MGFLSLYIHIPFCVSKCHYCDFNSYGLGRSPAPELEYVDALRRETDRWVRSLAWSGAESFDTVFFGGGTPSLFSADAIATILSLATRLAPCSDGAEVTLELNPKTAALEKMRGFREAGCNRLSMGVQTLDEKLLLSLARAHTAEDALQALEWAFAAGFEWVNADLMYGLPEQSTLHIDATLARLKNFPLRHLSAYELIVEEGTPFYDRYLQGRLPLPQTEEVLEMRLRLEVFAASKGMRPYETSNYACAGHESRHNRHYWDYDSFIGLGAGAVSFLRIDEIGDSLPRYLGLSNAEGAYGLRMTNPLGVTEYQSAADEWKGVQVEVISREEAMGEFMMMGLRKREGIRFADFEKKFLRPFPENFRVDLRKAREKGWMEIAPDSCRFTDEGMLFSNEVLREFLP